MKRLLIFCVVCLSYAGYAQDFCVSFPSGKTLCFDFTSSQTVGIAKNNKTNDGRYAFEGTISIPEKVTDRGDTYIVNVIGNLGHTNLTSVKLPESVTLINNHAFWSCQKLISINLPNSLTGINPCAFEYCSMLKSVTIPNSVKVIGRRAFKNTGLTSVVIPSTVEYIGRSTFENCHNLQTATIGCSRIIGTENKNPANDYKKTRQMKGFYGYYDVDDSYKVNIVSGAFKNCENMQFVTLTNSVTHIGDETFSMCSGLKYISIPESVKYIGKEAFFKCVSLLDVTINGNVQVIGDGAFYNCTSLREVVISGSATYIGICAFSDCVSLRDVVIPDGVTTLGVRAFANCRRLRTIKLPSSLVRIVCDISTMEYGHTSYGFERDYTSNRLSCYAYKKYVLMEDNTLTLKETDNSEYYHLYLYDIGGDAPNDLDLFTGCVSLEKIIIPVGSYEKFAALLPDYKDKLVEE